MGLNLARFSGIKSNPEPDETVYDFLSNKRIKKQEQDRLTATANAETKLAQDRFNLAKAGADREAATATETQRLAKIAETEKNDTRRVMGQYIQDRDFAQTAPVGVVNPRFLGKQPIGPGLTAPRDTSSIERETGLNLAKINPMTAEAFRTGLKNEREGDIDRSRTIAKEDRAVTLGSEKDAFDRDYKNRELSERTNNDAAQRYLQKLGITTTAQTAKDKAAQKKQLTGAARSQALSNKVNVGIAAKQLENVRTAYEKIKDRMGPFKSITDRLKNTGAQGEDFANYKKAIAALQTTVRKITRTPGEGSMSDWEGRLAQAQLPGVYEYPGTAEQAMNQIQDLIGGVSEVYSGYDLGNTPSQNNPANPAPAFKSAEEAKAAGLPAGTVVLINGEEVEID